MSKNNNSDKQVLSDATLGGALFPMALGLMAGVLISSCPMLNMQELQARLSLMEGAYVQEILVEPTHTNDVGAYEIASASEDSPMPDVIYKPNQWVINKSASTLSFEALQYGQEFSGSFEFGGEIIFNPDQLDECSVHIDIDIASIATGSLTRDTRARTKDWFDVEEYPKATFKSAAFTKSDEGEDYIAHGVLSLRGIDVPLDLPFSLRFDEETLKSDETELAKTKVEMTAQISLNRFDFGIGQDEWESEDVISDKVDIFVVLQAVRL